MLPIYEYNFYVNSGSVVNRISCICGGRNEDPFFCARPLQRTYKLLNFWPAYSSLPTFSLNED